MAEATLMRLKVFVSFDIFLFLAFQVLSELALQFCADAL